MVRGDDVGADHHLDVVGALTSACGPNGHGGSGLATDKGAESGHLIPVAEIGKGGTTKGDGPNGAGIGQGGDPMFTLQAGAQHGVMIAGTLEASAGRSRGAGTPPAMIAYGGNNTAGPIDIATAVRAKGGTGHGDFESETFVAHAVRPVSKGAAWRGDGADNLVATALRARDMARGVDSDCTDTLVAHSLRAEGFDASEDGTGRGTPIVPVPFSIMPMNSGTDYKARETDIASPVMAGGPVGGNQGGDYVVQPVHAFDARQQDVIQYGDKAGPLDTDAFSQAICFSSKDHGADAETDLAPTLRAGGHDSSHANAGVPPAVAFALRGREGGAMPEVHEKVSALRSASGGSTRDFVAFDTTQITNGDNRSNPQPGDACHPLAAQAHPPAIAGTAVRRLTPKECCRLQGFPDDYLSQVTYRRQCPPADGPMYKALGNSFATKVVRWIGRRIAQAHATPAEREKAA